MSPPSARLIPGGASWEAPPQLLTPGNEEGAVVVFQGYVRASRHPEWGKLVALVYTAYERMAESVLEGICLEAQTRHGVRLDVRHRLGRLAVGACSIVITGAGGHRRETFDAVREALEAVKHRAPIWKEEIWEGGRSWAPGASL